jgi:hypothetical protein
MHPDLVLWPLAGGLLLCRTDSGDQLCGQVKILGGFHQAGNSAGAEVRSQESGVSKENGS